MPCHSGLNITLNLVIFIEKSVTLQESFSMLCLILAHRQWMQSQTEHNVATSDVAQTVLNANEAEI